MRKTAVFSYIGYAIKSRNILIGVSNIINGKQVYLVLYDAELGKSGMDKINVFIQKKAIRGFCVNIEDFFPGRNCKAFGITEKNLAAAIIKEMEEGANE